MVGELLQPIFEALFAHDRKVNRQLSQLGSACTVCHDLMWSTLALAGIFEFIGFLPTAENFLLAASGVLFMTVAILQFKILGAIKPTHRPNIPNTLTEDWQWIIPTTVISFWCFTLSSGSFQAVTATSALIGVGVFLTGAGIVKLSRWQNSEPAKPAWWETLPDDLRKRDMRDKPRSENKQHRQGP